MYCGRNDRRRSAAEACDRIVLSVLERADLGAASAALRDCHAVSVIAVKRPVHKLDLHMYIWKHPRYLHIK